MLDNANWNFLKSELPRHYSSNSAFYIGLSDLITDGTFEWEHKLNEINKDGLYSKYIYPYYGDRWCKFEPRFEPFIICQKVIIIQLLSSRVLHTIPNAILYNTV